MNASLRRVSPRSLGHHDSVEVVEAVRESDGLKGYQQKGYTVLETLRCKVTEARSEKFLRYNQQVFGTTIDVEFLDQCKSGQNPGRGYDYWKGKKIRSQGKVFEIYTKTQSKQVPGVFTLICFAP